MALSWFDRFLQPKSRPVSRRPARARLGLEHLETREVPTVSSGLVGGQLRVVGDDSGNRITLDHVAGKTVVNGVNFLDSQITNGIVILSGAGADRVTLLRTVKPVTLEGQDGHDTVTISDARKIAADVTVTNVHGFSQININDSSLVHHNVVMGVDADNFGSIKGLAAGGATIRYQGFDVTAVRINTGTGGSTFTVNDTVKNN